MQYFNNEGAGAGAGAGVGAIMPINDARRLLGRKGKNMSDDDVKGTYFVLGLGLGLGLG